jgi:hypothetical protein
MTATARALVPMVVLAGTLLAGRTAAEPVVVTGGNVQVAVLIQSARIAMTGDDFLVHTGTADFFADVREFVFPIGTTVTLGGVWRPTDLRGGEATFQGVHYPDVRFGHTTR